ncbi:hypothetical protein [Lacibacter sediminis]|uniref:Right-handed parallel beta-helix repeat-containing protein n=1 Tax=Lacibacter sediminis TaxID=2760713 RepID=A0A7G5XFR3_9BACT|nr:hypothetical protein [Lacibacter sediminis]QNA44316.1 hypothetical protein H4075_19975 [Lacibacter sediminis]
MKIYSIGKSSLLLSITKKVLIVSTLQFFINQTGAQTPQFAVVRPDGQTFIRSSWDSAYSVAQDGDFLYLPGGTFSAPVIKKRLFIFGAGIHPDSSVATGRTQISNSFILDNGAQGGSIEGVNIVSGNIAFSYNPNEVGFENYSIKRCRVGGDIHLNFSVTAPFESYPKRILVKDCIISGNIILAREATENLFLNNVIRSSVTGNPTSCAFKNNIFLNTNSGSFNYLFPGTVTNCNFENNIFFTLSIGSVCNNSFTNNVRIGLSSPFQNCAATQGSETNTMFAGSASEVFESYTASPFDPFKDNYRLKSSSPGKNSGTDGTDAGIYGTSSPTSAGWVPSNPHIYFKKIAPQTDSLGNLNIQIKVRTNN